jgi:hypothetical protein
VLPGSSICGLSFREGVDEGRATPRTSRPVRTSERTIKVTVAGLFVDAADETAAVAIITEDSIKQILIFMFYFSVTQTKSDATFNVIISA